MNTARKLVQHCWPLSGHNVLLLTFRLLAGLMYWQSCEATKMFRYTTVVGRVLFASSNTAADRQPSGVDHRQSGRALSPRLDSA